MATQEDRSLSSGGLSFNRWMKTKMNDRSDFDQAAFSPTEVDGGLMFYYRNNARSGSEPPQSISTFNKGITDSESPLTAPATGQQPDFSKHTLFCQRYLNSVEGTSAQHQAKFPDSSCKTKSSGVDDGFHGEAAKCGTSVLRVAHQIVAGKVIRGFEMNNDDCDDGPPAGFNPALRRGSKSLPASPLSSPRSSPKTSRRLNKYFTGPFVDNENNHGWLLSNLLAKRKNLSQSVGFIAEEEHKDLHKTDSLDDVMMAPNNKPKNQMFIPQPSELREMNIFSPTSM